MFTYRFKYLIFLLLLISTIILMGCRGPANEAAQSIEAYIKALSERDTNQISTLSCADWEQSARMEVDSFTATGTVVKDLACQVAGQEGENSFISCTGKLALDYNGEAQEIDLSTRTYIARQEGGEWRMCGYR